MHVARRGLAVDSFAAECSTQPTLSQHCAQHVTTGRHATHLLGVWTGLHGTLQHSALLLGVPHALAARKDAWFHVELGQLNRGPVVHNAAAARKWVRFVQHPAQLSAPIQRAAHAPTLQGGQQGTPPLLVGPQKHTQGVEACTTLPFGSSSRKPSRWTDNARDNGRRRLDPFSAERTTMSASNRRSDTPFGTQSGRERVQNLAQRPYNLSLDNKTVFVRPSSPERDQNPEEQVTPRDTTPPAPPAQICGQRGP